MVWVLIMVWVCKRCCVWIFCCIKIFCDLLIYYVICSVVNWNGKSMKNWKMLFFGIVMIVNISFVVFQVVDKVVVVVNNGVVLESDVDGLM